MGNKAHFVVPFFVLHFYLFFFIHFFPRHAFRNPWLKVIYFFSVNGAGSSVCETRGSNVFNGNAAQFTGQYEWAWGSGYVNYRAGCWNRHGLRATDGESNRIPVCISKKWMGIGVGNLRRSFWCVWAHPAFSSTCLLIKHAFSRISSLAPSLALKRFHKLLLFY